jgi:hypothetical protein
MSADNTAPGEDILAWLENAITAREKVATSAAVSLAGSSNGGRWEQRRDERRGGYMVCRPAIRPGATTPPLTDAVPESVALVLGESEAAYIVANAPESVLRRCAADRKLLELHTRSMHSCPAKDDTGYLDEWTQFGFSDTCPVILLIAEGYGWTEGE